MPFITSSRVASRLPSEILSKIFQHSIFLNLVESDPDEKWTCSRPVIQVLGAVCSTWRQAAWATPRLWTIIDIDFKYSDIRSQILLLRLYLENAGDLPLDLGLGWDSEINFAALTGALVDPSIDKLIEEALWRVSTLYLRSPPSLDLWLSRLPELVSLDRLTINEVRLPDNVPLDLSSLTISEFDTYDIRSDVILPWRSITKLHLECVPVEVCVKLLLQCPNLELYTMHAGLYKGEGPIEPLDIDRPVVLPRLEKLTWTYLGTEWENLMVTSTQTPNLRDLCWLEEPNVESSIQLLATFFQRFPVTIRSLNLLCNSPHGFPLSSMPPSMAVERLELGSYALSSSIIRAIVDHLRIRQPHGRQPFWPFPKLKRLGILGHAHPVFLSAENTHELLATLAWRATDLGRTIILDLKHVILNWDPARLPALFGGENLIVRLMKDDSTYVIPLWYRQLAPRSPFELDDSDLESDESSD